VEMAKRAKKQSAAGLVNAVLRKAADTAREPAEKIAPADLDPADRVALIHSHPTWLVKRWLGRWGEESTRALLAANNAPPTLALAVHDAARLGDVRKELEAAGLKTEPGHWLKSSLNVTGGAAAVVVAQGAAWKQGWVSMQDEASQTVPLLLSVAAGQRVLDVCAAPGGKTVPLAQAAGGGAVIAADNDARRLAAVRAHLQRTGVSKVQLAAFDAAAGIAVAGAFDRILCDVPCSGTGTLRRNPEIRWRLRAEDLSSYHAKQARILRNAVAALAPGGRLVYATCSLEPEENEHVVREVIASNPELKLLPAGEALARHLRDSKQAAELTDSQGLFRTLPHQHGADGFFAAVLERGAPTAA